jgi:putative transposase
VVGLPAQREAVIFLKNEFKVSERKACKELSVERSSIRYHKVKKKNDSIVERVIFWAKKRPRYGHPRIHEMILRDGFKVNHKKTERIYYKELCLSLKMKKKKKRYRSEARYPIPFPLGPNKVWSMDFVSDQLSFGKRVRGLAVIDVFSKKNHALYFDVSLGGFKVIQILEGIGAFEEFPDYITVDNGPEFICSALDKWAYQNGIKLHFSRPGKPTDNAYIESFNGKLRDEFLNMHWFLSLEDLQQKAWDWRDEYNNERPHSSLGMKTPKEFLESVDKKEKFAV